MWWQLIVGVGGGAVSGTVVALAILGGADLSAGLGFAGAIWGLLQQLLLVTCVSASTSDMRSQAQQFLITFIASELPSIENRIEGCNQIIGACDAVLNIVNIRKIDQTTKTTSTKFSATMARNCSLQRHQGICTLCRRAFIGHLRLLICKIAEQCDNISSRLYAFSMSADASIRISIVEDTESLNETLQELIDFRKTVIEIEQAARIHHQENAGG